MADRLDRPYCKDHRNVRAIVLTSTTFLSLLVGLLIYVVQSRAVVLGDGIAASSAAVAKLAADNLAEYHVPAIEHDRLVRAAETQSTALHEIQARLSTQEAILARTEASLLRIESRLR